MTSDRQLWTAVLELAIADALGRSTYNLVDYRRDCGLFEPRLEAQQWIEEAEPDFHEVCHLAGLDPDAVRKRVLADRVGHIESTPVRTRRPGRRRSSTVRTRASNPPALKRAA
jgi:hypothetical protein